MCLDYTKQVYSISSAKRLRDLKKESKDFERQRKEMRMALERKDFEIEQQGKEIQRLKHPE
ncbi:MAG: hypothetical protein GY861_23220 [bacterium]|nr:hypothetical protein [bacterium]